ncbi:hypothetical protein Tco_0162355 [Tanacetum coccineum]
MIPKTKRLLKYTKLLVVSYGIDNVARPLLVWKSVRYGVSKELDTAYWGFLGVGTTLDIFQNIIFIPYLEYGVLSLSGYGVLSFILCGLIFRYLRGTVNRGLWYSKDSAIALTAFADADHTGCQDTRRSTSGSMQLLGDRLMRSQLTDYGLGFNKIPMYSDNKSVTTFLIKAYRHQISLHKRAEVQLADIFTKALCRERIEFLIDRLGMRSFTLETLKELADEAEE